MRMTQDRYIFAHTNSIIADAYIFLIGLNPFRLLNRIRLFGLFCSFKLFMQIISIWNILISFYVNETFFSSSDSDGFALCFFSSSFFFRIEHMLLEYNEIMQ